MIITKLTRLIVDDYPSNIEDAFIFYCNHKNELMKTPVGTYQNHYGLIYRIFNQITDELLSWKSYKKNIQITIVLAGEFFFRMC
ncbi:MAG: hypothetical protein ACRCTJ_06430 [Brevinema sp.]